VKKQIDEMMRAGISPEQFTIQHVRKPGQWVPIGGVTRGQGPLKSAESQALLDNVILRDVEMIVILNKFMIVNRPINKRRQADQRQSNQNQCASVFLRTFQFQSGKEIPIGAPDFCGNIWEQKLARCIPLLSFTG
jgi:hypothetical protein